MSDDIQDMETNKKDVLYDTYRYKVMVVDDSSIARKLIKKHAVDINANVVCEAQTADEAFDKYIEFEPDVVTMDVSMPGGTGLQAVQKIIRFDPGAKILMITSHGEEEIVIDALEAGAKGFMLKPVTREKLEEQFNKVKHDPYKMFKSIDYFENIEGENQKKLLKFNAGSDYLIFMTEKSKEMIPTLKDMAFSCIGAVFPQIIYNNETYEEGFLIFRLSKESNYKLVKDISEPIDASLKPILKNKKSILTITNKSSENLNYYLNNLSNMITAQTNVIGVAAGTKNTSKETYLFSSKSALDDSAFIIYSHEPIKTALEHDLRVISKAYEVTKIKSNVLMELEDNLSAYEIYKDILQNQEKVDFSEKSFSQIASNYPICVKKENDTLIRPILAEYNNSLSTLGGIEKNSFICFMKKDENKTNESIQNCILKLNENIKTKDMRLLFVFENIKRVQSNNETIQNDLNTISEEFKNITNCGAVSLLEFSNNNSKEILVNSNSVLLGAIH